MTSAVGFANARQGAPLFYAGWAGFALFGTLVVIDGHAEFPYALTHWIVAAGICAWLAMSAGKAAPIVGAVLGGLFALQMLFFVISSASSGEPLVTVLEDGFGLLAAVLILLGARSALTHRER